MKKNTFFFFLSLSLLLAACSTRRNVEQTATDFLTALDKKEYAKAKQMGTEDTKQLISLLQQLQMFMPKNKQNAHIDIKKMNCEKTGDRAVCDYCCNQNGMKDRINLVKVKDKWLVDMHKENGGAPSFDHGFPPPPPIEEDPNNPSEQPHELNPNEIKELDDAQAKNSFVPLPTLEKTAESFLQALDDANFADAAQYSADSLGKVFANRAMAEFALLSEDDKNKNKRPPSQETYYAVGCKADTANSNKMICNCKNFKATEKTTLTLTREDVSAAWKVVEMKNRKNVPAINRTNKEEVAANFIISLMNRDFVAAKKLATKNSINNIDFIAKYSVKGVLNGWDVSYYDFLSKIKCVATDKTATCPYCCNGEMKDDVLVLQNIDGNWFVNFEIK